jgi:peptidoglycan/xylan/chitin deacetylase (PgdA/CDA1 family)
MRYATGGVRATAKRVVERVAVGGRLTRLALRARRCEVVVLGYHNIVPDGEPIVGDRSLHLPQRQFAAQLDVLAQTHDVIPLEELLGEGEARSRPTAAITFDDGYRGAMTAGVAELARRGLPATVFIPPAYVGDGTFWWDALAIPAGEAFREHALTACRGEEGSVRAEAARRGIATRELPPHAHCVTLDELRQAARHLTVGSHTWSHANLAALDGDALGREMVRPLEWLRENVATTIPWLAYPYGRSSPAAEGAAARAGYAGSLLISGGWTTRPPRSAQAVPRLDVPGEVSLDGFALRIAGLVGG